MQHEHYWKLKAAMLERQVVETNARAAVEAAAAKLRAVMVEAGLDPDQQYALNDSDESITPQV